MDKRKVSYHKGVDIMLDREKLLKAASSLSEFLQEFGGEDAVAIIRAHSCEVLTSVGAVRVVYRIPEKYRTRCGRCGKEMDSRQNYCSFCGEWLSSNS